MATATTKKTNTALIMMQSGSEMSSATNPAPYIADDILAAGGRIMPVGISMTYVHIDTFIVCEVMFTFDALA